MTQSFAGVSLSGPGSIVNFGSSKPPEVVDIPVQVINSNSRDTGIVVLDGENSVKFAGSYTILTGGGGNPRSEYLEIKSKQGTLGTLINGAQAVNNVVLVSVSLAQELGNSALRCTLNFELVGLA